jgi:hypothetical protein
LYNVSSPFKFGNVHKLSGQKLVVMVDPRGVEGVEKLVLTSL